MKKKRTWKWYVPSFNGDLRLAASPSSPRKTILTIVDPTEHEKEVVSTLSDLFVERSWLKKPIGKWMLGGEVFIDAPLDLVGPAFVAALKPGPAVLTAVKYASGQVEVVEHHAVQASPYRDAALPAATSAEPAKPTETEKDLKKAVDKKDVKAAATVSRPTPCCPDCAPGSIAPAREVLLAFLTKEQHRTWAEERYVIARGNLTGHRYLLAHRNSELARKNTRICWDVEDRATIHFHNSALPPEEEVLSALLVLEHREHWLRNYATCLSQQDGSIPTSVFDNPFGTSLDGVPDAAFTQAVGMWGLMLANGVAPTSNILGMPDPIADTIADIASKANGS